MALANEAVLESAGRHAMAKPVQGSGLLLGRILGIPLYLHTSWFIIFLLITLSLRTQFVSQHPGWTPAQHWTLGIVTSILFFASVVFHELSHSVVATHYKIPVASITLFVFGGLSRIEQEPTSPGQEFNIAIAGPISSLFLAGCFWLVHRWAPGGMLGASCYWLAEINLTLGLFNLVPAFPLDGGRILRGISWGITHNFDRATQIASAAGMLFAYALILWGVWSALSGNWVGGLWMAFIGWFLLEAAKESLAHVSLQSTLAGLRAEDIMSTEVPTVSRALSLDDYVHEVLRTGRRCHIAMDSERPVGLMTLHAARTVPRSEWQHTSVQAVMLPLDRIESAAPEEPVQRVLDRMQAQDINQMPVMAQSHIVGMIGRDAILRALQTRLQAGHLAAAS
jgi:Zn-dependent protease/predicted transcriptional regulator